MMPTLSGSLGQASLPFLLKRKFGNQCLNAVVILPVLVLIAYWYPYEILLNGTWHGLSSRAIALLFLLPFVFLFFLRLLGIVFVFPDVLVSENGLFRVGKWGRWRFLGFDQETTVIGEKSEIIVKRNGKVKYRFSEKYYTLE